LQRYVRKRNDAKNPAILSFFFVTEKTQLNAAHAQLLEKLRPIAFAEIFNNTEHAVKTIYGELRKSPIKILLK